MSKTLSQQQKLVKWMFIHRHKKWWLPTDFMEKDMGECFVGYEASARLSELAKAHPDMIESEKQGKFVARRVIFETIGDWWLDLPADLKNVTKQFVSRAPEGK
jgi:hypothetical protein